MKNYIEKFKLKEGVILAFSFVVGYVFNAYELNQLINLKFILGVVFFLLPANLFIHGFSYFKKISAESLSYYKYDKRLKINQKIGLTLILFLAMVFALTFFLSPHEVLLLLIFIFIATFKNVAIKKSVYDFSYNFIFALPFMIGYAGMSGSFPSINIIIIIYLVSAGFFLFGELNPKSKNEYFESTINVLGYKTTMLLNFIFWALATFLIIGEARIYPLNLIFIFYPLLAYLIDKPYWISKDKQTNALRLLNVLVCILYVYRVVIQLGIF